MNNAQRAALNRMVKIADEMSVICHNVGTVAPSEEMTDLSQHWDAARDRYFELEAEAKQSRTAQQMARKGLGRKSTAGR